MPKNHDEKNIVLRSSTERWLKSMRLGYVGEEKRSGER